MVFRKNRKAADNFIAGRLFEMLISFLMNDFCVKTMCKPAIMEMLRMGN